jgi:hypothetical protein
MSRLGGHQRVREIDLNVNRLRGRAPRKTSVFTAGMFWLLRRPAGQRDH